MARAKKQQRHSVDLTVDEATARAGLPSRAAAGRCSDVLDLTQDDDADMGAGPRAAAAAPAKPAAKPRRKRTAVAADGLAAGPGAAQAGTAAEPAAGVSSQRAQHTHGALYKLHAGRGLIRSGMVHIERLMCRSEKTEGGQEGEAAKEGEGEAAKCLRAHGALVGQALAEGAGAHGTRHARCAAALNAGLIKPIS
jgi:hypothetical protein